MDAVTIAYLVVVTLLAAVAAGLALIAWRRGRQADRWHRRAERATRRADGWRNAYETVRAQQLAAEGATHDEQLLDLALTDNAYSLYRELEQR